MQLELSNFQPLAANDEEAPDLGGAEQLSEPMIEESDQGLASLIRWSRSNINHRYRKSGERTSRGEKLPAIRRGAHPSRDSPLCRPYRGRFGVGKDHL